MSTKPSPHLTKFSTIENLSKLAPIFTAGILATSVIYDSSYLLALGLFIADVPTSVSEHLRSALIWAPLVFIFLLTVTGIIIYGEATLKFKERNITYYKKLSRKTVILNLFIIIAITCEAFLNFNYKNLFIVFMFVWFLLIVKYDEFLLQKGSDLNIQIKFILIMPIFLSGVAWIGYSLGERMLKNTKPAWEYTIKKNDTEIPLTVYGQRRFTEFTIAVAESRKILILPDSNIISTKSL